MGVDDEVPFLSVANMKQIIGGLSKFLLDKYAFTLSIDQDIRATILRAMQDIERSEPRQPVRDKNKATLRVIRDVIVQRHALDEKGTARMGPMSTEVTAHPDVSVKSAMGQMERVRAQQDGGNTPPRFEDVHTAVEETALDEEEFKKKLSTMMLARDIPSPVASGEGGGAGRPAEEAAEPSPFDLSTGANPEPRMTRVVQNVEAHPKDFLLGAGVASSQRTEEEAVVPVPTMRSLREEVMHPRPALRVDKRFVMIHSLDRNWVVDRERYRYRVRFSAMGRSTLRVPYTRNNPTVPFTSSDVSSGLPNTMGWVNKDGQWYPPYDASAPKGDVLGYEEVVTVVEPDASTASSFRNVRSIAVTGATLPTEMFHRMRGPSANPNVDLPEYDMSTQCVLVNVAEFSDVYDGTSDAIRRAFCVLRFESYHQAKNGRRYVNLAPVQQEAKVFHPVPLASLNHITLSLHAPNGTLISASRDGVGVLSIAPYMSYYMQVFSTTYFTVDAFHSGDLVLFKNHRMYMFDSNEQSVARIAAFNDFVNRPEGHVITELGAPNEYGFYNNFTIFGPSEFDEENGRDVPATVDGVSLSDELGLYQTKLYENGYYEGQPGENGVMLNVSMQHTISMTIETESADAAMLATPA